jgi:hypothetical protein
MDRNFERLRHGFFQRSITKNIVNEPSWHRRMNNGWLKWAMSRPLSEPVVSEIPYKRLYERPEVNPLTQHYIEHTYGLETSPEGGVPWLIELARINVPEAYTVVLKGFEQYLEHPDVQNPIYFSVSGSWGRPFQMPADIDVVWMFRVERGDTAEPPQINVAAPSHTLPGTPHFEVAEMRDLWFPAGSPPSQNFHLTIGGRYRLRVLALVTWAFGSEYQLQIAAKVRGFRVSAFDTMTLLPVRSVW